MTDAIRGAGPDTSPTTDIDTYLREATGARSTASAPEGILRGVRARVLTGTQHLGPFETPAAALRWRANGPFGWWCVRSGWVGSDLRVQLDDGMRVLLPLSRLRIDAHRIWAPQQRLPPRVPDWVARLYPRGACWWWEVPIQEGSIVQLDATLEPCVSSGYRTVAQEDEIRRASHAVLQVLPSAASGLLGIEAREFA